MFHVTCTRAHACNTLVANSGFHTHDRDSMSVVWERDHNRDQNAYTSGCAIRGHICACVLAIGLGFCDTPRVLHSVLDINVAVKQL